MPKEKRPWFRVYCEIVHDAKLRRLTLPQRWLWICILAAARSSPEPGFLFVADGIPTTVSDLAQVSDLGPQAVIVGLQAMTELGLVAFAEEHSAWFVTAWWDRQFESDFRHNHRIRAM